MDSEKLDNIMLGPTFPNIRPICSSTLSPGRCLSLCNQTLYYIEIHREKKQIEIYNHQ